MPKGYHGGAGRAGRLSAFAAAEHWCSASVRATLARVPRAPAVGAARASREGPGSVPAAGGTANGDEGESAGRENALDPSEPEDASETSRQRLRRWLTQGEHDFETLRDALGLGVRALERELRHVARSARREGRRLAVQEAACLDCGFVFDDRSDRHLHPPSRCPGCRSQRIAPPRFRLTGSGTRR